MKVAFFASEKQREQDLARAFIEGVRAHGGEGEIRSTDDRPARGFDAAVMVGVKSKALFDAHMRNGVTPIMLDKGYLRHRVEGGVWEYWRVAVNAHHPTAYLMARNHPHDRMEKLGLDFAPWRKRGEHIILAGSSAKYHSFYRLPDPTDYAEGLVRKLRRLTNRHIVYRPKPSWRDAVPLERCGFSGAKESLDLLLSHAHCLVTHGSNACFEALLAGVPCIVLGNAVARPVSSTALMSVHQPMMIDDALRRQWLANLCYHQWTMDEFASGEAWPVIRERLAA